MIKLERTAASCSSSSVRRDMAASSEHALPVGALILRVLTLILLIISLAIIAVNKVYLPGDDAVEAPPNYTFRDVYAYRYVLAIAVIGCAYTLFIIPFAAINVAQRRRFGGSERAAVFLIFTDVVFAVLFATGAAAGLGYTAEHQRYQNQFTPSDWKNFYNIVDESCGLLLAATICMVIMIMMSVHSLTK